MKYIFVIFKLIITISVLIGIFQTLGAFHISTSIHTAHTSIWYI